MESIRVAFENVSVNSAIRDPPRGALPYLVTEFPAGVKVDADLAGIIKILNGGPFPPDPLRRGKRSEVSMCRA